MNKTELVEKIAAGAGLSKRRLLSSRLALSSLMLSKPDIVNKNLGVPIGTPFLSAL